MRREDQASLFDVSGLNSFQAKTGTAVGNNITSNFLLKVLPIKGIMLTI